MTFAGAIGRLRRVAPSAADLLIVVALAAGLQIQFVLGEQRGSVPVNVIGGLLFTLPLAWRRRAPFAVVLVLIATAVVNEALGGGLFSFPEADSPAGPSEPTPPFASLVAGAVAFYSLGAHAEDRRAVVGGLIGVAGLWATVIVSDQIDVASFLFSGGLVAATPWLAGRATRSRGLRIASLEREQEQRAHLAVSDERQRIAREVHDVIAHSVGVMVVQADGARRVLERDPDRAREALRSIGDTGRTALSELQRSLGVLREGDAGAALTPQPGMGDVETLVQQAREAGLRVAVAFEGDRRSLPQGIDLAGYRIVQEGLTNILKHAGAVDTRVAIRYGQRDLEVEVADDGPGPSADGAGDGSGHGLVGMRERVALYGGELQAGPGPEGGFLVRARIPLAT